jgi:hypothetical protein
MKNYFFIICLSLLSTNIISQDTLKNYEQKVIVNESKKLISKYNNLREKELLPKIEHDSILDMISNEVLINTKKYKNAYNSIIEDSLRYLLYNNGVLDYKYEIFELSKNDSLSSFDSFLLNDRSDNIRCGFAARTDKKLLIKTKSYLMFGYTELSVSSEKKDWLHSPTQNATFNIIVDSVKYHVKERVKGEYCYYYSDRIPSSSSENFNCISQISETKVNPNNSEIAIKFSDFNLVITSKFPKKFIVIKDKKNEIIGILK